MKKQFFKILILLFLIGNLSFSEYVIKNGKVFYDEKEVIWNVDIESFRALNDKIAVDSQNIYFLGNRAIKPYSTNLKDLIPVVSREEDKKEEKKYNVKKFELILSKEKKDFYFLKYDKKIYAVYGFERAFFEILDVDYGTFKEVSKNFVKDKNKIYFIEISRGFCNYSGDHCQSDYLNMIEIEKITPKNFKVISDDLYHNKIFVENDGKVYFIDSKNKFKPEELNQIDAKTFKVLDYRFIKDKNNVYFYKSEYEKFVKFKEADTKTFEIIGEGYAKDKDNVYFLNPYSEHIEPIKMDADKNTFELIKFEGDYFEYYAKDKNNVYCGGKILEEVDYKTFKIFKEKNENGEEIVKIKDKNHEYDEDCRMKDEY